MLKECIYAQIAASMMLEPLGEVGANFSLQLSSRRQFTKINNKKVIAENQCEKHKKSSLTLLQNHQLVYSVLFSQYVCKLVNPSNAKYLMYYTSPQLLSY